MSIADISSKQKISPAATEINPANFLYEDTEPENEINALYVNSKLVGSLGNIITITGKPKSRKTTFLHSFIASFLSGKIIFNSEAIRPDGVNIALIDTEQSKSDLFKGIKRIKGMAGIKKLPSYFKVYQNRPLQSYENRQFLQRVVLEDAKLKIIFIDGMLDFVADMNNIEEASDLLFLLQKICFENNILIICILHENKASNYTLGHVGSFLERKSQSLLRVEKNEAGSTLSSVYMRSDEDFYPISIYYNYNSESYQVNTNVVRDTIKTAKELTQGELLKIVLQLYETVTFLTYTELSTELKRLFKNQSSYFVKQLIERFYLDNLIIKIGEKIYNYQNKPHE
jgi:hypothetical protein